MMWSTVCSHPSSSQQGMNHKAKLLQKMTDGISRKKQKQYLFIRSPILCNLPLCRLLTVAQSHHKHCFSYIKVLHPLCCANKPVLFWCHLFSFITRSTFISLYGMRIILICWMSNHVLVYMYLFVSLCTLDKTTNKVRQNKNKKKKKERGRSSMHAGLPSSAFENNQRLEVGTRWASGLWHSQWRAQALLVWPTVFEAWGAKLKLRHILTGQVCY